MDTINPEVSGNSSKKTSIIILLIIIIFILTGVLAYALLVKKAEAPTTSPQSAIPVPAKKGPDQTDIGSANEVKPLDSPAEAAMKEKKKEEEQKYSGWMTYTSDKYKYQIKFPSGTVIRETEKNDIGLPGDSKMTFDEAYAKVTGQVCVQLDAKKGSVYVSAPVNKGFAYVLCGRTGVGSDTKVTKSNEKITIGGKEYTISVNHFSSPNESSTEAGIVLDDDTQFYVSSGTDAGWAEVKKMVESFKKIK